MTINEIKEHLGIDLTIKDRRLSTIIIKSIWIEQELKKQRKKSHIAKDLKLVHASVLNIISKSNEYKKVLNYKEFLKAYKNKDFIKFKKIETYIRKDYQIDKLIKNEKKEIKRWSVDKIISTLRKDNKCRLWNKPMNKFDENDYEKLRKLSTM